MFSGLISTVMGRSRILGDGSEDTPMATRHELPLADDEGAEAREGFEPELYDPLQAEITRPRP